MFIYCFNECNGMEKAGIESKKKIERSQFEEAAYLLRALSNETRLCVIMQLSQTDEKSVTELMAGMDCEQSLLSHHLTDMRAKGILACRRSGKNSFYSIRDRRIINVLRCIMGCSETNILKEND